MSLRTGSCSQVAQSLVSPHRHRAKTWLFDTESAAETPRNSQHSERKGHLLGSGPGGVFTQRRKEGTGAEGTKGPEPGRALGVQGKSSVRHGEGAVGGTGWKVGLGTLGSGEPAEPFMQQVPGSGLRGWLSGDRCRHRGSRTERLVASIFIQIQASNDDRPELIMQTGASFSR